MQATRKKHRDVYKDLETGIVHYSKRKANALYKNGHRIRVYEKNRRTKQMTPICEWVVGSFNYFVFTENDKELRCHGGQHK